MHPDKICHMCGGTGRNRDGDTCPMCGARVSYGHGRIRKEIFVQGTNHDEWPIAHPNLFGLPSLGAMATTCSSVVC
jgi:hypothetical protein